MIPYTRYTEKHLIVNSAGMMFGIPLAYTRYGSIVEKQCEVEKLEKNQQIKICCLTDFIQRKKYDSLNIQEGVDLHSILCADENDLQRGFYLRVDKIVKILHLETEKQFVKTSTKKDDILAQLLYSLPFVMDDLGVVWDIGAFIKFLLNWLALADIVGSSNVDLVNGIQKMDEIVNIFQNCMRLANSDEAIVYGEIYSGQGKRKKVYAAYSLNAEEGKENYAMVSPPEEAALYHVVEHDLGMIDDGDDDIVFRLFIEHSHNADTLNQRIKLMKKMFKDHFLNLQQQNFLRSGIVQTIEQIQEGVIFVNEDLEVLFTNKTVRSVLHIGQIPHSKMPLIKLIGALNHWIIEACETAFKNKKSLNFEDQIYFKNDGESSISIAVQVNHITNFGLTALAIIVKDLEEKRKTRMYLDRYVGRGISEELIEKYNKTSREVTIVFTDLREFTSLVDRLGPSESLENLNSYFTFMEDVISNNGGYIDKFMGDAIMALFGLEDPENGASLAVKTVLDMYDVLKLFNAMQKQQGKEELMMRVGVATGSVIVGNIGSNHRRDFSVIGKAVNASARIVDINKQYGTDVMIDQRTLDESKTPVLSRHICEIAVRGQTQKIKIHEISTLRPRTENHPHEKLYTAYEYVRTSDEDIHEKTRKIKAILKHYPDDHPTKIMAGELRMGK